MNELFRFEPFWGKYIFSHNGVFYGVSPVDFNSNRMDNCNIHVVQNKIHFKNALSAPLKVQIQYTNRCCLLCGNCYATSGKSLNVELTYDEIYKLLLELKKWGVLQIEWTGGDVFARKNFLSILSLANEIGFEQGLLTNGIAIGKGVSDYIEKEIWKFCHGVQITINGFEDNFNKWVSRENAWSYLIRGLSKLKKTKPKDKKIAISTTLNFFNIKDLTSISEIALNFADIWRLGREVVNGRSVIDEDKADLALFKSWQVVQELRSNNRYKKLCLVHPFGKDTYKEGSIWPIDWISSPGGRILMYVSANGQSYVFPYFDGLVQFSGGNVKTKTLSEIWSSKNFEDFRNINRVDTGCGNCNKVCRMWSREYVYFRNRKIKDHPIGHFGCEP